MIVQTMQYNSLRSVVFWSQSPC